jgi:exosortase D (VPLPA-CTERM-specific)
MMRRAGPGWATRIPDLTPTWTRDGREAGASGRTGSGMSTSTHLEGRRPSPELAVSPVGIAWFALAIVSTLPLFWFGLAGLVEEWSRPEYSHGPIIPLLSFYMFLREMKYVPPAPEPVRDRWPGVVVIGLGLVIAVVGNLVQIDDIVFYALIVWIAGLILTCVGWRRGLLFWPSVVYLVFMLPLPTFLYWKINSALQLVSSEIGVWFVRLMGVPVFLEGNIIDLGVYKLQVAEACSGLRYLFPIMSFSYVFAVLYRGPHWHKIVLLLAAVPIAVLMNSFRIGVIGVMVDRYGIAHAEGFLHFFEGWIIFVSCIAILFAMAVAMRRLSGSRGRLGDAIDMDFTGLGDQLRRVFAMVPSRALVAAALITATLSSAWALTPSRPPVEIDRDPFSIFPRDIAGWSGTDGHLERGIERILGADDYLTAYYRHPGEAAGVDLFLSYYRSQTDGSAIHSPEVCLPGAGWEVFGIRPTEIALPGTRLETLTVNRALIQKGLEQQLVYYWFEGRGRQITNDFAAKFLMTADRATTGRSDGGLVRVITPIGEDGEAAADARLQRFLVATVDRLPRFIPE